MRTNFNGLKTPYLGVILSLAGVIATLGTFSPGVYAQEKTQTQVLQAVNPSIRTIDPNSIEGKELMAQFLQPSLTPAPVIPSAQEATGVVAKEAPTPTRIYHHPILNKISQQAVVNIQTTGGQSEEKQAVGSGFFITQDGYIVTNFHVISEHFFNPSDTRLLVRIGANNSTALEASLENVDIVKDLALLKISTKPSANNYNYFEVSADDLDVGQKVYSLGFPNNWNLTAIEGIANGSMSKKIIPRYLISHSLTSGMSGGPTVDETGRVVGINVAATAKLSVVIPSKAVGELFNTRYQLKANTQPESDKSKDLNALKTQYLRDKTYQDYENFTKTLVSKIADNSVKMKLGDFNLRLNGDFLECWSAGLDKNNIWSGSMRAKSQSYDNTLLSCGTTDEVFLNEKQKLGGIKFYVSHYNANTDFIFWKNLENIYNLTSLRNANLLDQSAQKSGYHCRHENIQIGAAQKIHTCVAQLKQNPNLYQAFITIGAYKEVQPKDKTNAATPTNQAVVMTVILNGLSPEQLKKFQTFLYQFLKEL